MVFVVVSGVVTVTASALLLARSSGDGPFVPAVVRARAACAELRELRTDVIADADADQVLDRAAAARSSAVAAARAEFRWTLLATAVATVERGLLEDDAEAAADGMAIAGGECERADEPLEEGDPARRERLRPTRQPVDARP